MMENCTHGYTESFDGYRSVCPYCENATLRAEVERLKEESSHLWVRIESGEAAAYEQGKAEARKQAAREIIEEVIGDWNCDCGYGGLVIADAIKAKFGLEGVRYE